jgi:hypothetical protein
LHLAQIYYNQAYYDAPNDYLSEPSFLSEGEAPLGTLRAMAIVRNFLEESRKLYIEHVRGKLIDIIRYSAARNAHIIVFPEYSVPVDVLPDVQALAKELSIIIVAGSHRVPSGDSDRAFYEKAHMLSDQLDVGAAVSPILLADGTVELAQKMTQSKWEPNLRVGHEDPRTIIMTTEQGTVGFCVVPCIDCLRPEVIGKLWSSHDSAPNIVICPSLSPLLDPFKAVGQILSLKDTLLTYANAATFGGTSFNIPKKWEQYLSGVSLGLDMVPRNARTGSGLAMPHP